MRKITIVCCLLVVAPLFGNKMFAQDAANGQQASQSTAKPPAPPVHYYRLNFVVEELGSDGKPVNSRAYSTSISTEANNVMSIRTDSRVPFSMGPGEQVQFENVDVNFDVRHTHEVDRQLAFDLTAEVNGFAEPTDATIRRPVTRQNRWQTLVLMPVGKPSVVITSDSLDGKGSTRVLITATLLQ